MQLTKDHAAAEHALEIESLQTDYTAQIKELQDELQKEKEKSARLENQNNELKQQLTEQRESLDIVRNELENERNTHKAQLVQLQQDLEEKEKVTVEIKALQQQTRSMVRRAQSDWESKNEELKRMRTEQENTEAAIKDLLQRFSPENPDLSQVKLDAYIRDFKKDLEGFEHEYDMTMNNLAEVTKDYNELIDIHNQWRTIAGQMADILEEYRRQVVLETIQQLELPTIDSELNILQKKVTPSDDVTAMWTEIVQLISSIDTQKFVRRIHTRVKDNYQQAKLYKKEYKSIKGKDKIEEQSLKKKKITYG